MNPQANKNGNMHGPILRKWMTENDLFALNGRSPESSRPTHDSGTVVDYIITGPSQPVDNMVIHDDVWVKGADHRLITANIQVKKNKKRKRTKKKKIRVKLLHEDEMSDTTTETSSPPNSKSLRKRCTTSPTCLNPKEPAKYG